VAHQIKMDNKNNRFRLKPHEITILKDIRKPKVNRLVIGDIHLPYTHKNYLRHCQRIAELYNCTVFSATGDVIDSHFGSFHSTSTQTHGAKYELDMAIEQMKDWSKAFPKVDVTIGNHDLIVHRKSEEGGIDKRWIRDFNDVLDCPGWNFQEKFVHDNVLYVHGTGCSGKSIMKRVQNWGLSMVQGHIHTESFAIFTASLNDLKFGVQVPCGIDYKSWAYSYAKFHTAKPILGCAVILDNGKLPIICPMEL
jgi:hypothetical protein